MSSNFYNPIKTFSGMFTNISKVTTFDLSTNITWKNKNQNNKNYAEISYVIQSLLLYCIIMLCQTLILLLILFLNT
jgi:hypothetical protein